MKYRYEKLDKAVENARELGFSSGAALYLMVAMNGEESHNEWEITFEEIYRNGAVVFATINYTRSTGDCNSYIPEMELEEMIAVVKIEMLMIINWFEKCKWKFTMSNSEVMTIIVLFHLKSYSNIKGFYCTYCL